MTNTSTVYTGKKFKELRADKGYSQRQVEKALGWSSGSLSKYEKEIHKIPEDRLDQLINYFGLNNKNSEGYVDTTMSEAIKKAMTKYADPLPGEVWVHKRSNCSINKLILNIHGNVAFCVSVFANSSRNTDFKLKAKTGETKYAGCDRLEAIRLKEFDRRSGIIADSYVEDLKLHLSALLGVAVIKKEVVKEVPVEKIVEVEKEVVKEVPVEKIVEVEKEADNTELLILRRELDIYKDMVDRLLPKRGN